MISMEKIEKLYKLSLPHLGNVLIATGNKLVVINSALGMSTYKFPLLFENSDTKREHTLIKYGIKMYFHDKIEGWDELRNKRENKSVFKGLFSVFSPTIDLKQMMTTRELIDVIKADCKVFDFEKLNDFVEINKDKFFEILKIPLVFYCDKTNYQLTKDSRFVFYKELSVKAESFSPEEKAKFIKSHIVEEFAFFKELFKYVYQIDKFPSFTSPKHLQPFKLILSSQQKLLTDFLKRFYANQDNDYEEVSLKSLLKFSIDSLNLSYIDYEDFIVFLSDTVDLKVHFRSFYENYLSICKDAHDKIKMFIINSGHLIATHFLCFTGRLQKYYQIGKNDTTRELYTKILWLKKQFDLAQSTGSSLYCLPPQLVEVVKGMGSIHHGYCEINGVRKTIFITPITIFILDEKTKDFDIKVSTKESNLLGVGSTLLLYVKGSMVSSVFEKIPCCEYNILKIQMMTEEDVTKAMNSFYTCKYDAFKFKNMFFTAFPRKDVNLSLIIEKVEREDEKSMKKTDEFGFTLLNSFVVVKKTQNAGIIEVIDSLSDIVLDPCGFKDFETQSRLFVDFLLDKFDVCEGITEINDSISLSPYEVEEIFYLLYNKIKERRNLINLKIDDEYYNPFVITGSTSNDIVDFFDKDHKKIFIEKFSDVYLKDGLERNLRRMTDLEVFVMFIMFLQRELYGIFLHSEVECMRKKLGANITISKHIRKRFDDIRQDIICLLGCVDVYNSKKFLKFALNRIFDIDLSENGVIEVLKGKNKH